MRCSQQKANPVKAFTRKSTPSEPDNPTQHSHAAEWKLFQGSAAKGPNRQGGSASHLRCQTGLPTRGAAAGQKADRRRRPEYNTHTLTHTLFSKESLLFNL
eukprot:366082-Chlamydomonas_euryale.AAC.27